MAPEDTDLISMAFEQAISDARGRRLVCEPGEERVWIRVAVVNAFRSGVADIGLLKLRGVAAVTVDPQPAAFTAPIYGSLSALFNGCEKSLAEAGDASTT